MTRTARIRWAQALGVAAALALLASTAAAITPLPPRTDKSVYDTAGLIDDAAEAAMESRHIELYEKTGVAIVVLTVERLQDETIDELAVRAGQTWGVGKQGQDRGLVIALTRDDRKIYVATGYGTEGFLPDGKVGAILDREAVPDLRANRTSEGLVKLDRALAAVAAQEHGVELTGVPPPPPTPAAQERPTSGILMTLIGLAVFVFIALRHPWLLFFMGGRMFGGGRSGGFGGGGGFGGFGGGGFGGGGAGRDF